MKRSIRNVARAAIVTALMTTSAAAGTSAGASTAPPIRNAFTRPQSGLRVGDGSPRLQYWGGAVIANVNIVVVLWGSGRYTAQVTRTAAPNISTFFAAAAASPYVDWLREYNPRGFKIGRGTVRGRVTITPAPANDGRQIDDVVNIRPELLRQIRAGRLPKPDANTLYAIFFPAGPVISQGGHDSVTGFCAYHNTVRYRGAVNVRYAVLPATAATRKCGPAPGFANLTIAASHELVEAITDPDVGLASKLGPPLGWYDPLNGEIADICAGMPATLSAPDGRTYTVQKLWSNRRHACVAS